MEDTVILTLRCKYCENHNCKYCPDKKYIIGIEGCTRIVDEETAAIYEHYTQEVIPFWKHYS